MIYVVYIDFFYIWGLLFDILDFQKKSPISKLVNCSLNFLSVRYYIDQLMTTVTNQIEMIIKKNC